MKKFTNHFAFLLCSLFFILISTYRVYAIDYTINFTGSGASSIVDSVLVSNLTQGKSVIVPQGYQLNLTDITSVEQIEADYKIISIIPNPITEKSVVSFYAKQAGNTQISVVGIDGRIITSINCNLQEGKNSFQLSLNKGAYILKVSGNGFYYSSIVLSRSNVHNIPILTFVGNEIKLSTKPQKTQHSETITMLYKAGDQILYKGYSANSCTVVTDKPLETKTTDFKFVDCTDADGNHYAVVHIGTQTWMAENLKTTKYRNGVDIGTTTPANKNLSGETEPKYQWAYDGDEKKASKYGRLYTWYAVTDARNIAPAGWRVATDAEWTTLENYLIANGYNYDGTITGKKVAKSMAATTDWTAYSLIGSIGSDLSKNNKSVFTALPGGYRYYIGTFNNIGSDCTWWVSTEYTSTNAWVRSLSYKYVNLDRYTNPKNYGFSVRCIMNETTNPFNIETALIPAGTFTMGSPEAEVNRGSDETQYSVTLSAFRMSKYEITNAQYASFLNAKSIGSNGLYAAGAYPTQVLIFAHTTLGLIYSGSQWIPVSGYENNPVLKVTWYGAIEYATYVGGSLPTEAQWEYACRAGTTTPFNTGSCMNNLQANYNWEYPYSTCTNTVTTYPGKTQAVGSYAPNGFGLYDMHGNVWEWCANWYGIYPTTAQTNPIGSTTGSYRVYRGGGWGADAMSCRSSFRFYSNPISGNNYLGFRVVFVP